MYIFDVYVRMYLMYMCAFLCVYALHTACQGGRSPHIDVYVCIYFMYAPHIFHVHVSSVHAIRIALSGYRVEHEFVGTG